MITRVCCVRVSATLPIYGARRNSKTKRKMERKIGSGRKGTVDEEEYLLRAVTKLVVRWGTVQGEYLGTFYSVRSCLWNGAGMERETSESWLIRCQYQHRSPSFSRTLRISAQHTALPGALSNTTRRRCKERCALQSTRYGPVRMDPRQQEVWVRTVRSQRMGTHGRNE